MWVTMRAVRRGVALLALATGLGACESEEVAVSIAPPDLTLTGRGESATIAATVTVDGEIQTSAAVAWSSSNPSVATVAPNGLAATITSVDIGTADITASLRGSSAITRVTVFPTPTPKIAISVAPLAVVRGQSGSVGVVISRTAYTAPLTLTLEGAPAGISGVFGPAQTNGTQEVRTLTVTADASAPVGQHTLLVRCTGAVSIGATTTLVLTVNAGS